jgi:elongation factor P
MLQTSDFRKNLKIKFKGDLYVILDFQHAKTAQRRAVVRTKLRNLRTGQVLEESFAAGDVVEKPDFSERMMQYLYSADDEYHFMDSRTYEQVALKQEQLGDYRWYLQENLEYKILFFEGQPLNIDMPSSVVLKVVEAEPAVKGDSVSNIMKNVKLETGLTLKVPLFIKEGDRIKIDTRSGEYLERA